MLKKIFAPIFTIVEDGIVSLVVALILYAICAIALIFIMIPVSIFTEGGAIDIVSNVSENVKDISFKLIFTIVFISMLMRDLKIIDHITRFRENREKKKLR